MEISVSCMCISSDSFHLLISTILYYNSDTASHKWLPINRNKICHLTPSVIPELSGETIWTFEFYVIFPLSEKQPHFPDSYWDIHTGKFSLCKIVKVFISSWEKVFISSWEMDEEYFLSIMLFKGRKIGKIV